MLHRSNERVAQRRCAYTDARTMSDPSPPRSGCAAQHACCEVSFSDGSRFELPFEYLRVHSPSAEVKGHGPGQEVLVLGKENVGIARGRAGRASTR